MRKREDIVGEHTMAAEVGFEEGVADSAKLEMEVLLDIRDLLISIERMLRGNIPEAKVSG